MVVSPGDELWSIMRSGYWRAWTLGAPQAGLYRVLAPGARRVDPVRPEALLMPVGMGLARPYSALDANLRGVANERCPRLSDGIPP